MKKIFYVCSALMLLFTMTSCDMDVFDIGKDPAKGTTYKSDDLSPISDMLAADGRFGEFVNTIKAAGLYSGFNQSSAGVSYTVFAPTDEAMAKYETALGSKVADMGQDYARSFVLYHAMKDSILPDAFVTKSSITNLTRDKINVAVDTEHTGEATLTNSNSQAQVIEMGISASNGKIYVLSSALTPLVETVYDRLNKDQNYNIFLQAVKDAKWDKMLNTISDTVVAEDGTQTVINRNFSVLGVTDKTFGEAGISNVEQLKQKLVAANTKAGLSADSLLRAYVGYHIVQSKNTVAALGTMQGESTSRLWSTGAQNLVFTLSANDNEEDMAKRYAINPASGTPIHFVESGSNILALNGYLHQVDNWMPVWEPEQQTVVWDLADDNEIRTIVEDAGSDYQPVEIPKKQVRTSISSASCIQHTETETKNTSFGVVTYCTVGQYTVLALANGAHQANNNDCVVFNLGNTGTATMTTPTIVRGKYRVKLDVVYNTTQNFMRTKSDGSGGTLEVTFDGKNKTFVAPYTQVAVIPAPGSTLKNPLPGVYTTVLYDEIEFDSTSSHTFSFKIKDGAASSNGNFSLQFDTMTFEPIDD